MMQETDVPLLDKVKVRHAAALAMLSRSFPAYDKLPPLVPTAINEFARTSDGRLSFFALEWKSEPSGGTRALSYYGSDGHRFLLLGNGGDISWKDLGLPGPPPDSSALDGGESLIVIGSARHSWRAGTAVESFTSRQEKAPGAVDYHSWNPSDHLRTLLKGDVPSELTDGDAQDRKDHAIDWQEVALDSAEAREFFEKAETQLHGFTQPEPKDAVRVRRMSLPFYKSTFLFEVLDRRSGRPRRSRFLLGRDVVPIRWNSAPIHGFNPEYLQLTDENVVYYVRFFGEHIRGDSGFFRIVESLHDLHFLGSSDGPKAEAGLYVGPAHLWNRTPIALGPFISGESSSAPAFLVGANVAYGSDLYRAVFLVPQAGGALVMVDDDLLVTQLSVGSLDITDNTHFKYLTKSELP